MDGIKQRGVVGINCCRRILVGYEAVGMAFAGADSGKHNNLSTIAFVMMVLDVVMG